MNEHEWRTSTDPRSMIQFLGVRTGDAASFDRYARLFAAACCRIVWDEITDEPCRAAVEVAEWYALGLASEAELARSRNLVDHWLSDAEHSGLPPFYLALAWPLQIGESTDWAVQQAEISRLVVARVLGRRRAGPAPSTASSPARAWYAAFQAAVADADALMSDLLRCLAGNLFWLVRCDPAWRTSVVVGMADGIHADRAFDRLPILADALEEAGCADARVLAHCRDDAHHARGCWVVEMILRPAR